MNEEILGKEALELEARKELYDLVRKHPGCHFREIERRVGMSTGSVSYHLGYLSRHGLLEEQKTGNNVRYYVKGMQQDHKILGLLRQKSIRRILACLLIMKSNHAVIVEFVGLSPSTVSWHLKKLEEQGVISSEKIGRQTFYELQIDEDELTGLLITHKDSFFDVLIDNVVHMWDS